MFVYTRDAGPLQISSPWFETATAKVQQWEVDGVLYLANSSCAYMHIYSHSNCNLSHPANLCGSVVMGLAQRIKLKYASRVKFIIDRHVVPSTDTGQQVSTWGPTPFGKVLLPSQKLICSWAAGNQHHRVTWMYLGIDTTPAMATLLPHTLVCYQITPSWEQETLSCYAAAEYPWTPRRSESLGAGGAKAAAMPVSPRFHPHSIFPCI